MNIINITKIIEMIHLPNVHVAAEQIVQLLRREDLERRYVKNLKFNMFQSLRLVYIHSFISMKRKTKEVHYLVES